MRKIKIEDTVIVTKGKDRGKEGRVVLVDYKNNRLIVENINIKTHFVKPTDNDEGGMKKVAGFFDMSNVSLKDPKSGKATRIRIKVEGKDKKRVSVKTNTEIK
jgi:large subunit ribosomal protein L24